MKHGKQLHTVGENSGYQPQFCFTIPCLVNQSPQTCQKFPTDVWSSISLDLVVKQAGAVFHMRCAVQTCFPAVTKTLHHGFNQLADNEQAAHLDMQIVSSVVRHTPLHSVRLTSLSPCHQMHGLLT